MGKELLPEEDAKRYENIRTVLENPPGEVVTALRTLDHPAIGGTREGMPGNYALYFYDNESHDVEVREAVGGFETTRTASDAIYALRVSVVAAAFLEASDRAERRAAIKEDIRNIQPVTF